METSSLSRGHGGVARDLPMTETRDLSLPRAPGEHGPWMQREAAESGWHHNTGNFLWRSLISVVLSRSVNTTSSQLTYTRDIGTIAQAHSHTFYSKNPIHNETRKRTKPSNNLQPLSPFPNKTSDHNVCARRPYDSDSRMSNSPHAKISMDRLLTRS